VCAVRTGGRAPPAEFGCLRTGSLHVVSLHVVSLHVVSLHVVSLHVVSLHVVSLHVVSLRCMYVGRWRRYDVDGPVEFDWAHRWAANPAIVWDVKTLCLEHPHLLQV
jgi:hypothetical protein